MVVLFAGFGTKDFFYITFCSVLMCFKILNVKSSCFGGEFQFFNVLLHTKSEQVIGNLFCCNNLQNSCFSIRNILITICVGRVGLK